MATGDRVRKLRERKGLRQDQLALLCGKIDDDGSWEQSKVSRIETGQTDVTVSDLEVMCRAMGTSLERFFSRSRRGAA